MQTHLVGVTLPCERCGKMFGSKRSLNKHNSKCLRKGQTLAEETVVEVGYEGGGEGGGGVSGEGAAAGGIGAGLDRGRSGSQTVICNNWCFMEILI